LQSRNSEYKFTQTTRRPGPLVETRNCSRCRQRQLRFPKPEQIYPLPNITPLEHEQRIHSSRRVRGSDQMACYSLPYRAIAFVSHLLTYYPMFVLHNQRRPLVLWSKANLSHPAFSAFVGAITPIATTVLGAVSTHRC